MAQCAIKLRPVPTKRRSSRQKFTGAITSGLKEMIGLDVSDAVVQVMACELRQQDAAGNDPTHMRINSGRGPQNIRTSVQLVAQSKPSQLVFRAQAYFGATQDLLDAARDAYILLRSLTRFRSPATAKENYAFYMGNSGENNPGVFMGTGASGLMSLRGAKLNQDSTISIIGPLTTYGRKLYWNPLGGKTVKKRFPGTRNASRQLGVRIKGGFTGTETIHTDVKKRMRRKAQYKALSIGDPFYTMPFALIVGTGMSTMKRPLRMPAITIQVKKAGRLR